MHRPEVTSACPCLYLCSNFTLLCFVCLNLLLLCYYWRVSPKILELVLFCEIRALWECSQQGFDCHHLLSCWDFPEAPVLWWDLLPDVLTPSALYQLRRVAGKGWLLILFHSLVWQISLVLSLSFPNKAQPSGPCWFCLASPEVEKHLVVSIGTHVSTQSMFFAAWWQKHAKTWQYKTWLGDMV